MFRIFILIQIFTAVAIAQNIQSTQRLLDLVSIDSLFKHLHNLGHDSMEGRGTGSPGEYKAASYIRDRLIKYGILPFGENHTFYQQIPMHGSTPLPESNLRIWYADETIFDFSIGDDYLLYKSGAQTFVPSPTPLVFVGYGIVAPEFDYNDYQSVDVRGKIAVFIPGEPSSDDSSYFAGDLPSIYSLLEAKERLAFSRGAVGSILISDKISDDSWNTLKREFSFEDITLSYNVSGHLSLIMNRKSAVKLFRNAKFSFTQILKQQENNTIQSFPLSVRVSFNGEFIERDFITQNVIGLIPKNPNSRKDGYLILSAHYDHLGIGPSVKGDSIYNGVFDNASGVSVALEISRILAKHSSLSNRSVIMLFLTGEEKGLLGSSYYIDHPVVPLYQTIANINIDGIAMFETFTKVIGVGSELSTLKNNLSSISQELNLQFVNNSCTLDAFSKSDQISFAKAGIPSMLIMEGLDIKNNEIPEILTWMKNYYHTPFDDLHQPMNLNAARLHAQIILATCIDIINMEQTPQWNTGIAYQNIRLQTIAEKR